jgi:hypothetical protein
VRGSCADCGCPLREDVACNVSTRNSCFQFLLHTSDFLLPTSSPHRRGVWAACRPGRKHSPPTTRECAQDGWIRGCPTGVKTLRATSHRQELPASNFHFLLPTSCFRLPTSSLHGASGAVHSSAVATEIPRRCVTSAGNDVRVWDASHRQGMTVGEGCIISAGNDGGCGGHSTRVGVIGSRVHVGGLDKGFPHTRGGDPVGMTLLVSRLQLCMSDAKFVVR